MPRTPAPNRMSPQQPAQTSSVRRIRPRPWLVGVAALPLLGSACGEPAPAQGRPRNLLLITVDTLRADHLGCYGYGRPTSAAIDGLAAEGVVFERAWASSSWTLPTLASLMSSVPSAAHGAIDDKTALNERFETLAEMLAGAGFKTGAIVNHYYLNSRYGLAQGFEDYDEELVQATRQSSHIAVTSPEVTEKANAWIAARAQEGSEQPWFLWVHYFDPHALYVPHDGLTDQFADPAPWGASLSNIDCYDGEIAFTDGSIGELLAGLEEAGFGDDTAVMFVADHGEEFFEHGMRGHRKNLHRETVQVPLILRVPGIPPGRVTEPVGTLDVLPTALRLFELEPRPELQGRSLLSAMLGERQDDERAFLAELRSDPFQLASLARGRWRLIHDELTGEVLLFDVERDPGELVDLAEAEPEVRERMLSELQAELERARALGAQHGAATDVELSPEDRRQLGDLGYGGDARDED